MEFVTGWGWYTALSQRWILILFVCCCLKSLSNQSGTYYHGETYCFLCKWMLFCETRREQARTETTQKYGEKADNTATTFHGVCEAPLYKHFHSVPTFCGWSSTLQTLWFCKSDFSSYCCLNNQDFSSCLTQTKLTKKVGMYPKNHHDIMRMLHYSTKDIFL